MNQNALKKNKRTRRRKEERKGLSFVWGKALSRIVGMQKIEIRPKNLLKNKKLKGIRLAYWL